MVERGPRSDRCQDLQVVIQGRVCFGQDGPKRPIRQFEVFDPVRWCAVNLSLPVRRLGPTPPLPLAGNRVRADVFPLGSEQEQCEIVR
jgi:hypothetical protein